jgi:hypothetical protein
MRGLRTDWLCDTVVDAIPEGVHNAMNDVIEGYNEVKRAVEPVEKFVSTVASVASKVADTVYGWFN